MVIEIDSDLKGSILDIGGGGEAVIGQMCGNRVTAIDNCQEEIDEAPDCCTKLLMDAGELSFSDGSFDNVTFRPCPEGRRKDVHLGLHYPLCLSRSFCC